MVTESIVTFRCFCCNEVRLPETGASQSDILMLQNGTAFCTHCSSPTHRHYEVCSDCNRCGSLPRYRSFVTPEGPICILCVESRVQCAQCGLFLHLDVMECCPSCELDLCSGCAMHHVCPSEDEDENEDESEPSHRVIHTYDYKPYPVFWGGSGQSHKRFFGVELEIDGGGESFDNARRLLDLSGDESLFYIKHDGSLSNGMEIVTHPATLVYHRKEFPWASILELATTMGYKSHQTSTCGLHVHISKASLGVWEVTVPKLILLFWKHWENLLIASRRVPANLAQYARINVGRAETEALKQGKWKEVFASLPYPGDKYVCINPSHPRSVEIRLFRGTLKRSSLIASIQLVDVLADIAITHGTPWITNSTWSQVLLLIKQSRYNELISYLQERQLFPRPTTKGGVQCVS